VGAHDGGPCILAAPARGGSPRRGLVVTRVTNRIQTRRQEGCRRIRSSPWGGVAGRARHQNRGWWQVMMQSNQGTPGNGGGCGARLRLGRDAAGPTPEGVSARLKMPVRVIRVLESDDWSSLGAPVFVRGQLRSYARLLGLDVDAALAEARIAVVTPPELVSHTHTPRIRRVAQQVTRRAVYIAVTAAIAVPVWMATSPHLGNNSFAWQAVVTPAV